MRFTFRKIAYAVLGLYFLVTCYTGFVLFRRRLYAAYTNNKERIILEKIQSLRDISDDENWNPWGEEFENENSFIQHHEPPKILWEMEHSLGRSPLDSKDNSTEEFIVEVWGKAAIGIYLWEHILGGLIEKKMGGVWSYGVKKIHSIKFRLRTGPGVIPSKVPRNTENLLLVLNGREPSKTDFAKLWLDFLPALPYLKNVAVVILGNEQCNNDWLKSYMQIRGGPIKFAFLVYDSPDIDNVNFYQWPLGVATYRDFPKVDTAHLPLTMHRKYLCNFMGTIYRNSSREILMNILEKNNLLSSCYVKPRKEWMPQETDTSREEYMRALAQSDLTLNPVGVNTECYRIYEALSYGSLPVVEDVMTPGNCGSSSASLVAPLRLLKEYNAPIVYMKDWNQIVDILDQEAKMPHEDKVKRRQKLIQWYENFKSLMRERLVRILEERFFNIKR
ncbi:ribitol-5-phosphate xylosyltransferase 1-like [Haliotis asinina]|uniref:ribitol-5-phosphate xylosyltransferase 1-like n=1 Tax=Haliotis asinina TaxID=109174 RepID=UPI003532259C